MNGVNRMKRFGLVVAVVGTLLMVPLSLIPLFEGRAIDAAYFVSFGFLFAVPLFCGGALYLCGWILEGFLRPQGRG